MESKGICELLEISPSKTPSLQHREDHTAAQYDSGFSKCHHWSYETPVKQCCAANGKWISDVVMCYFLPALYMKGQKCPHPIHRVLLCSILGPLPRPYMFAEPGNVLPRGLPVVIMCRSPAVFEQFCLEKENVGIIDVINTSSSKIAARFSLGPVSEDTAGGYSCFYIR